MQAKWVSLSRLKIHEFNQTLRHLRHMGRTWHDIYTRLGEMQQEATLRFLKSTSTLLFVYLIMQSLAKDSEVSLTLFQVTASIPVAYVCTVGAIFLFVAVQQLQSVMMIIQIRSKESIRPRIHGFSANMYGLYHGQDEMALTVPVLMNKFFKESVPVSSLLTISTLTVYLSLLLPIIAFAAFLLSWQFHILQIGTLPWIERIAASIGAFAVIQSIFFVMIFNLPLPLKKNTDSIRWGVLHRLHPLGSHPRVKEWLTESEKR